MEITVHRRFLLSWCFRPNVSFSGGAVVSLSKPSANRYVSATINRVEDTERKSPQNATTDVHRDRRAGFWEQ